MANFKAGPRRPGSREPAPGAHHNIVFSSESLVSTLRPALGVRGQAGSWESGLGGQHSEAHHNIVISSKQLAPVNPKPGFAHALGSLIIALFSHRNHCFQLTLRPFDWNAQPAYSSGTRLRQTVFAKPS